jgi:DNA-binding beta-propeller fold protein YncE
VINNSNKIVVVNSTDFVKTATITGLNSPRYILPITYNKAYVSDLYANSIQIIDLNSNSISGSIPCINGTEQMALIYNKAFVTNSNSNYCYVINTITDVITDSIHVGKGNSSICVDKNSKLWILSTGNSTQSIAGKLSRINPVTLQVEQSLNFSSAESPNKLCINKTRDTLYYLNNGVFKFPITSTTLPSNAFINQGSKLYYGLGINPKDYNIYVADAIDYVQKSKVEIYKPNGNFVANFNAGIISNSFCFE